MVNGNIENLDKNDVKNIFGRDIYNDSLPSSQDRIFYQVFTDSMNMSKYENGICEKLSFITTFRQKTTSV